MVYTTAADPGVRETYSFEIRMSLTTPSVDFICSPMSATRQSSPAEDPVYARLELAEKAIRGSSGLCRTCSSDWQVAMDRMTSAVQVLRAVMSSIGSLKVYATIYPRFFL